MQLRLSQGNVSKMTVCGGTNTNLLPEGGGGGGCHDLKLQDKLLLSATLK